MPNTMSEYRDRYNPLPPHKPFAYRKLVRMDMTERRIKRRLRELTKYWESTDWIWVWNEHRFSHNTHYNGLYTNKPSKFWMQPHRMHKQYAYRSSYKWDEDCYITRFYNRPKEKWRNVKEQSECWSALCTGNIAWEEDLWEMEEYSNYYEVDSYYWREWQKALYFSPDWGRLEYYESMRKNHNPLFYKIEQWIDWNKREELDILYYKLSKGG